MQYFTIILLSLFFIGNLSVIIKQEKKQNLLQRAQIKRGQVLEVNLQGYPQEILQELNFYRRKEHYSPVLIWYNSLASTAQREANDIVNKHSFGEHANFINWRNQVSNSYFTELALIVNTEGMMPPKRIFAKTVIESLKQEQEWYLIHGYTHAGVAIVPDKIPHHFIVVVHLAKSPTEFHSCKEALDFGIKNEIIEIVIQDKSIKVKCDQSTAGGGWTRVLDMSQQSYGAVNTPINDLGLSYTQLLFRAKPNYAMDYAKDSANNWDFDGFVFYLNAFKFDNIWYISSAQPTHGEASNRGNLPKVMYNQEDKNVLEIIKGSEKCFIGATNRKEFCGKEFILKSLPKGRLNAISDIESISKNWIGDNSWNQQYEIYLR